MASDKISVQFATEEPCAIKVGSRLCMLENDDNDTHCEIVHRNREFTFTVDGKMETDCVVVPTRSILALLLTSKSDNNSLQFVI